MATTTGDGYPHDWEHRRKAVFQRDQYTCQNCGVGGGPNGGAELHAHHLTPKSQGGSHDYSNLVTLCSGCHSEVHGRPVGSAAVQQANEESGRPWKWGGPLDHAVVAGLTGWWSFGLGNLAWAGAVRLGSFSWNPLKWGRSKDD